MSKRFRPVVLFAAVCGEGVTKWRAGRSGSLMLRRIVFEPDRAMRIGAAPAAALVDESAPAATAAAAAAAAAEEEEEVAAIEVEIGIIPPLPPKVAVFRPPRALPLLLLLLEAASGVPAVFLAALMPFPIS